MGLSVNFSGETVFFVDFGTKDVVECLFGIKCKLKRGFPDRSTCFGSGLVEFDSFSYFRIRLWQFCLLTDL